MRRMVLAVAAVAGLGAASCGGGSDESKVRTTVQSYLDSLADGDYDKVCSTVTDNAVQQMRTAALLDDPTATLPSDCPGVVKKSLGGSEGLSKLHTVEIKKVRVNGSKAYVLIQGATASPTLVKNGGDWKIDDLGLGVSSSGSPSSSASSDGGDVADVLRNAVPSLTDAIDEAEVVGGTTLVVSVSGYGNDFVKTQLTRTCPDLAAAATSSTGTRIEQVKVNTGIATLPLCSP